MKVHDELVVCMVIFSLGLFFLPAHADLKDGLVAYYPFNGNANDESENGNHGTVNGATLTEDRFGKIDRAYHFDGNSYIVVPNSPSLESPFDQYSVAVWANTEAWDSGLSSLVCKGVQGAQYRPQFSEGGRFLFQDFVDVFTNFFANLNTWYFFVVIWNNGNAQVYVNGTKIGENSGIPVVRNSEPLEIGRDQPGAIEYMIGAIDDIRIYNRALSESEIQELYRERSGPSGLITIDFDALPGMPNGPGLAVPLGSRLSNQLQPTTGAVFSSAAGYVAVVDLNAADPNHAISAPNGIGGVNASGQLSYGTPITVTFFEPGNPLVPAVSNFIQIRGDQIPLSGATATLEAFDVFGSSLGAITAHDATGGLTLTLSVPGIHAARISQNSAAFGFDGTIAFDNLTFSLEGLVVVSDLVSFEPIRSTYQFTPTPTGCPAGFVGTFSFDARLTNTSESSVSDLVVMVTTLTNGNLLQNADGGPAGVGARLTVPQQEGFTDGVLTPDEFVHVPFIICLQEQERFIFMVDVLGLAAEP